MGYKPHASLVEREKSGVIMHYLSAQDARNEEERHNVSSYGLQ
jgi:hypothetical protein